MKIARSLGSRRGVSLVETLVAVVLISSVGIIIVQLLHKNTLNMVWNRQTRRAATLADMVLEKYDYLSGVQFATLDSLNQTNVPVSSFFSTGVNNQGYDGMTITTVAEPIDSTGNRKLDVTINWGAGTANQTFTISKYLSATAGTPGGAPVYVYVLDNNGAGIPGFEVRAAHHYNPAYVNAIGTNEVIAFTDNNGYAVLNNVAIAASVQPMQIYARKMGSDASIKKSKANYVQGYYSRPANAWNTKTITVTQTSANNVTFDMRNYDFLKLGSVSGILTNDGGSGGNLAVRMVANATSSGDDMIDIQDHWDTVTDTTTAAYEFNNIAPGAVELQVRGNVGSYPTVQPGAGFVQGYVGYNGNGSKPWYYDSTMADPPTNTTQNLQARNLGSLALTVKDQTMTLLPGATVSFTWPNIGLRQSNPWTGVADANGQVNLYNLFAGDAVPTLFTAWMVPNGCVFPGAYLKNFSQNCSAAIPNTFTLVLNPGASITGMLTDTSSNPIQNMQISVPGLTGTPVSAVSGAGGAFTLCGVGPDTTVIPTWPTVTFSLVDLSSNRVSTTFSGTTVDKDYPAQAIPNVQVTTATTLAAAFVHNTSCGADPNPTNARTDTIISDASGNYGPVCAYNPFQGSVTKAVTGTAPSFSAGTLVVDTSLMQDGLCIYAPAYYTSINNVTNVTNGSTFPGFTLKGTLVNQAVSGIVTESGTGVPLQGVIFDACSKCNNTPNCNVTTDATGAYGPVNVCVAGRKSNNTGSVTLVIPSGATATNTGKVYNKDQESANIPSPARPATPVTVNFVLTRKGSGI